MHKRQIVIDKETWHWFVGRTNIVIWGPDEAKHVVRKCDLVGWTPYEVESANGKHAFRITPGIISTYIKSIK